MKNGRGHGGISVIISIDAPVHLYPGSVNDLNTLLNSMEQPWQILVIDEDSTGGTVETPYEKPSKA